MNQTPAAQKPSRKKILLSVLVLAALTGAMVLVFKDSWADIASALSELSAWQVATMIAIGLTYPVIDGLVTWLMVSSRLPGFSARQGIDVSFTGSFCTVATFGAGVVPMQTYYLYRCGLGIGPGFGLMTLQYAFHKSAVLIYATVMMLVQHKWLAANSGGRLAYLPWAYFVVALIVLGLVLLCISPLVQQLARWALGYLPKSEKWQERRAEWLGQLDDLASESRVILADKLLCIKVMALQLLKLFLLFTLPYLCIRFMGLASLGFWQVQLLTSLMLFLSNALPNLAGMGSVETAFLLMFSDFLGQAGTISTMMLYRIASYYAVFAASCVGFVVAQKRLGDSDGK